MIPHAASSHTASASLTGDVMPLSPASTQEKFHLCGKPKCGHSSPNSAHWKGFSSPPVGGPLTACNLKSLTRHLEVTLASMPPSGIGLFEKSCHVVIGICSIPLLNEVRAGVASDSHKRAMGRDWILTALSVKALPRRSL